MRRFWYSCPVIGRKVKLHASAKELEALVYQRIDSDVEKVRNQFKINSFTESSKLDTPQEVPNWLIGLTLAVSRRANNSFAIDYRSDGALDGNQLIIKEYLEARSRVFECHGRMSVITKLKGTSKLRVIVEILSYI